MLRPSGYVIRTDRETGKVTDRETFMCRHCNRHTIIYKARQRPEDIGGFCRVCGSLICSQCVDTGKCDTLEAKLQRAADQEYFRTRMKEW